MFAGAMPLQPGIAAPHKAAGSARSLNALIDATRHLPEHTANLKQCHIEQVCWCRPLALAYLRRSGLFSASCTQPSHRGFPYGAISCRRRFPGLQLRLLRDSSFHSVVYNVFIIPIAVVMVVVVKTPRVRRCNPALVDYRPQGVFRHFNLRRQVLQADL